MSQDIPVPSPEVEHRTLFVATCSLYGYSSNADVLVMLREGYTVHSVHPLRMVETRSTNQQSAVFLVLQRRKGVVVPEKIEGLDLNTSEI